MNPFSGTYIVFLPCSFAETANEANKAKAKNTIERARVVFSDTPRLLI